MSLRLRTSLFVRLTTAAALAAVAGVPMLAHDMWIEPTTFLPALGQIVGARLRVGQDLLGDPIARDPALIHQFVVDDGVSRKPLVGRDGADPAGYLRVGTNGLLVVGYQSNASPLELTAEKFNQYLKEEGLESIAALRARRQETGAMGREQFYRCAKSLVLAGPAAETQGDRPLGFTLELVAERNPYALRTSDDFPVRLEYRNRPLAGALVVAINRLNPAEKLSMRTDSAGRVRFRLQSGGLWLVKAVHMVPAPAGSNGDWTSYWASLTFQLPIGTAGATHD